MDLGPNKKRIAQLFRVLGSNSDGERRNAFAVLVRTMQGGGITWTDIGDVIANGEHDDGKFTENEMQEIFRAARAEGVEAGIRMGMARASNGNGNGHGHGYTLPEDAVMAEYCQQHFGRLRNDSERDFVSRVYPKIQRRRSLSLSELGFLASVYIKSGGKV